MSKPLKHIRTSHVLQHDQSDCGVACLQSLIRFYGGDESLEHLRKLSGTSKQGTSLLGLYQAAQQLGFDARGNEADIQALIDHGKPVILHVVMEKTRQHYIVCYTYKDDSFIIGDPASGVSQYTKEELSEIWLSKTCLTLEPNTSFKKTTNKNTDKRKWFFSTIEKDYRIISFSLLLGVVMAILGMTMAVFSQKLIDDILPSKNLSKLITGIFLVAFLLFIRIGFNAFRDYFLIRQSKDFNNRIIDRFYNTLLHLPKSFFDSRKLGDFVARLNDTQRIQRVINKVVGSVVIDVLVTLTSLGLIIVYSWQSALIVLFSLPLYAILLYRFNQPIISLQKEVMSAYAMNESNYISSIGGIQSIKNNNKQAVFRKTNQLIYGNFQDKSFNLGKINIKLGVFSSVFSTLFLVGILAYGSIEVYHDRLQLGELMAILGVSGSLLPSVANLALISIAINEARVAFNRMFEYASIAPEESGEIAINEFKKAEAKNVSFRFPGNSLLLKDINLSIKSGECVVLVGESGTGKSTLIELFQKNLIPESGAIEVNEHDSLNAIKLDKWRTIIGVVPQKTEVFNANLLTNITFGDEVNPEEFDAFCKDFGFNPFLKQLPQGLATILGEEGINLSGGQLQMLGLMRALYKKPKFLLLDEFTSAMDRNTEKIALDIITRLKKDIGVLFITHRLNIVPKVADTIYVLENKRIELKGTHAQLLSTSNFYSEYWKELSNF